MLYLIGLGLNLKGISLEGIEAIRKCGRVYLESYTVEFPYGVSDLEKVVGKKVEVLNREEVEGERLVDEASKNDVGLLVYGCPLFATTHMSLIESCKNVKVIYAASVFDGIASCGLQLYKFGKISSMPKWAESFKPVSFLDYVKENLSIGAHSLILIDIGLKFDDAVKQLIEGCAEVDLDLEKIVVCSRVGGDDAKIFYGGVEELRKKRVRAPFCFVIPGKMHFMEEEILEK
jgi:diphthine methyl ester synthase